MTGQKQQRSLHNTDVKECLMRKGLLLYDKRQHLNKKSEQCLFYFDKQT